MSSFSRWPRPPEPLPPAVSGPFPESSFKPASKPTPKPPGLLWEVSEHGTYPEFDQALMDDDALLPVLDPQACKVCQMITVPALTYPNGFEHHSTEEALLSAANRGCRLCLWVCSALFLEPWLEGKVEKRATRAPTQNIGWYQYPPILRFSRTLRGIKIVNPYEATERNILRVYTNSWDPASSIIRFRRICNISTVETTLRRFSRFLNPTKSDTTVLPKRVIDVGETNDDVVILRDFGGSPPAAHYVCLSHRWQRSCPLITTQSDIKGMMTCIAMKDLSATLRDAIFLTRGLNIRYLWIDSLCILQDSPGDWELESSKMGSYYSRGWLTIAAGLDNETDLDPSEFRQSSSIFGPRYKSNSGAGYYRLLTSDSFESGLYFNFQDELTRDNRGSSQLFSRGWTLQEEALSPRFMSFQPRQTSLRIGSRVFHESGFDQNIWHTSFIHTDDFKLESWAELIEDYSQRRLSMEGDKLPALSGIAQLYQGKYKDKYLAGLWLNCLLKHLCWCVPSGSTEIHRPFDYRAPSWSWASLDGKIVYDRSIELGIPPHQIKILEATTTPAGQDPLGQVREGSITLETQLSRQYWRRGSDSGRKWFYANPVDEHRNSPSKGTGVTVPFSSATLLPDVQDNTIDDLELWSLPIHDQFALALQAVDLERYTFRRIGAICWRSSKDDGDQGDPTVIITII